VNLLRGELWRIGLPDSISRPVFWATFVAGLIGTFASVVTAASVWQRLAIACVGQAILWVPMLVLRPKLMRQPGRSRPALVLGSFLLGAVLRAVVTSLLLRVLFGPQEVAVIGRVSGIFLNMLPTFLVSAFVVSVLRERRRQIAELATARIHIEEALQGVSITLEERNSEAVDSVRKILEREFARLEGAEVKQVLAVLQHTASEVVRPMSHQLAQSLPDHPPPKGEQVQLTVPWSQVLDSAASGRPFRPWIVGLFMGAELLVIALQRPQHAPIYALLDLMIIFGLGVANRVIERVNYGRSRSLRITVTIAAAVIVAVGAAITVPFLLGTSSSAVGVMMGLVLFGTGFTLGTSVLTALARERNRTILELQKSFKELERVLVRQRQAVWFQRKALSRALHGPVQMVVTAAAIRLDGAIRDGAVPPELIVQIRSELISTLDVLDELDEGSVSFSLALERMRAMWEGICVITEQSSAEADAVLARGGVLESMVIDIATEAVSNAVWHGNATIASIRLDVVGQESDDLLIEVTTDGQGIDAPKRRGLGTQLLDDCSLKWSGEASEAGDCLTAVLPFASV
jgi:hypothetical protein